LEAADLVAADSGAVTAVEWAAAAALCLEATGVDPVAGVESEVATLVVGAGLVGAARKAVAPAGWGGPVEEVVPVRPVAEPDVAVVVEEVGNDRQSKARG